MEPNTEFDKMERSSNEMFLQMYDNNSMDDKGNLIERLKKLDAQLINNEQELTSKLFDFNKLNADMMPTIVTNDTAVIIFDNVLFNSTYLIDLVIEARDNFLNHPVDDMCDECKAEHEKKLEVLKEIKFYYCNNPFTRAIVFNGKNYDKDELSANYQEYEKTKLAPSLMYINQKTSDIRVLAENKLSPMMTSDVEEFINELLR